MIDVSFEVDPHTDATQPPLEPIVFQEGGPGLGSTFSRGGYLYLAGPLRARHDVIMMDPRGTGHSQPVECPAAQNDYLLTQSAIMQCGVLLGDTADLYGTGLAADDLDAILSALGVARSTYTATPMEHSLARHILPAIPNGCALLFLTARTR